MNFLKRSTTSQVEDASALQLALLEEAERNIYGDTALWKKSHSESHINLENKKFKGKSSIYENIFEESQSDKFQFSASNIYDGNNFGSGKSLFPVFDWFLYLFPMWITRDRRFACFNVIGMFITFIFATFYRYIYIYIILAHCTLYTIIN